MDVTGEPLPPHQPNCLGCGDENPGSMGLRMWAEGERIRGEVTLDRRHEGAPGFAHGGAIATVLDDALGSLLMLIRKPAVTAKLEIDYRKPAFIGRRFEVASWVESMEGRKLHLAGNLKEQGETIAEARALFLTVDVEHFAEGARKLSERERGGLELPW
jgi:acyl-coenzyme A thioesterase PaaI-like protein